MAIEGVYSAPAAMASLLATTIFTFVPNAVVTNSLDVVKNNELGGAICQRTGRWYPASQIGVDGTGLLVGNDHRLDQGVVWPF